MTSSKGKGQSLKPCWEIFYFYALVGLFGTNLLLLFSPITREKEVILDERKVNAGVDDAKNASDHLLDGFKSMLGDNDNDNDEDEDDLEVNSPSIGVSPYFPVVFIMYSLASSTFLLLSHLAFERSFYRLHVVEIMSKLHSALNQLEPFPVVRALLVTNVLHRSADKCSLVVYSFIYNVFRFVALFAHIVVASHEFHRLPPDYHYYRSASFSHTQVGILLISTLTLTLALVTFALFWRTLSRSLSAWGRLSLSYSKAVDRLDVARGRRIPAPIFSPFRSKSARKNHVERVLESLNPYSANGNVALCLDLIAAQCGPGAALKCLSHLEADVMANWRPFQLSAEWNREDGLTVTWRDPLAVLYLTPVPRELGLHFAISVKTVDDNVSPLMPIADFPLKGEDELVKIVGYDESRYYRRVWHSSVKNSVDLDKSTETSKLCYEENFPNLRSLTGVVEVFCVVDGHLIANSSITLQPAPAAAHETNNNRDDAGVGDNDVDDEKKFNAIAKPPRSTSPEKFSTNVEITINRTSSLRSARNRHKNKMMSLFPPPSNGKEIVITPAVSSTFDAAEFKRWEETAAEALMAMNPALNPGPPPAERAKSLTNLVEKMSECKEKVRKTKSLGNKLNKKSHLNDGGKRQQQQQQQQQHGEIDVVVAAGQINVEENGANNLAFEEESVDFVI